MDISRSTRPDLLKKSVRATTLVIPAASAVQTTVDENFCAYKWQGSQSHANDAEHQRPTRRCGSTQRHGKGHRCGEGESECPNERPAGRICVKQTFHDPGAEQRHIQKE